MGAPAPSMMVWELLLAFLRVGFFAFGGGMAALPLIEREVVTRHGWLTSRDFVELVALSEMSPGPIGINAATFAGFRAAGVAGSVAATVAFCLPSLVLVVVAFGILDRFRSHSLVASFLRGLRPAAVALIAVAAVSLTRAAIGDWFAAVIAGVSFFLVVRKKIDPVLLILLAGVVGMAVYR